MDGLTEANWGEITEEIQLVNWYSHAQIDGDGFSDKIVRAPPYEALTAYLKDKAALAGKE